MIIQAERVFKALGAEPVLADVSFTVSAGDKVGLVGPNGSGKTTLVRLVLGELEPDRGRLVMADSTEVGYVRQDVLPAAGETPATTVLGAAALLETRIARLRSAVGSDPDSEEKMRRLARLEDEYDVRFGASFRSRAEKALGRLGFERDRFDQPVRTMSPGERTRLELAKVLVRQPDLLVLDEPTNFLDIGQREWLEDFLARFAGTVLVVSHDRVFLNRVASRMFDLRRTRLTVYEGDYDAYEQSRALKRRRQEEEYELQAREIRKLERVARERKTWAARKEKERIGAGDKGFVTHRAAKLAKRARHAEKRVEQMLAQHRAEKPFIEKRPRPALPAARPADKRAVLVRDLEKAFGGRKVLDRVGFELRTRDKVGLVGPNGCGKTVLLETIVGRLEPDRGEVRIGAGVKLGYFPQDLGALDLGLTPVEEVRKSGASEELARTVLGTLLLSELLVERELGTLSAGERSKTLLARILASGAGFLVLDEPTNHLDIDTLEALEELLVGFPGGILFASHDRRMLDRLPERVLELNDGKLFDRPGQTNAEGGI